MELGNCSNCKSRNCFHCDKPPHVKDVHGSFVANQLVSNTLRCAISAALPFVRTVERLSIVRAVVKGTAWTMTGLSTAQSKYDMRHCRACQYVKWCEECERACFEECSCAERMAAKWLKSN